MSRRFPFFDLLAMERDFSTGGARGEEAKATFRTALREQGLFYVGNTGLDMEALSSVVDAVTEPIMSLPAEQASQFTSSGALKGLAPCGAESTAAVVGKGSYSDLCAKWTYWNKEDDVVPADSGRFRAAWADAYQGWDSVAVRLLKLIGQALDLAGTPRWEELFAEGARDATMRLLRYPDVPADRASDVGCQPERMAPHTDLDVITLLHQTPCSNSFVSLQGYIGGEWVGVPAREGTLVVNFGEALSILSSGAVKATMHRVLSPPSEQLAGSARRVLAMFWMPPAHFQLQPLRDSSFKHFAGADGLPYGEWLQNCLSALQRGAL